MCGQVFWLRESCWPNNRGRGLEGGRAGVGRVGTK